MNASILALIFMGIILVYGIAITLLVRLVGMKIFKDKSNMYFLYASLILVIQIYSITKDLLSEQHMLNSSNILFFLMGLMFIVQGVKTRKKIN
ncbi:hypothetical protein ACK8P5_12050 [Paenibacillus sp. EC2-1]|uniref:hypothetical protein n=1 Tax=Paenibacillus sp. EC2-1 TaxID=3388665 RepID=UPI003BEF1000